MQNIVLILEVQYTENDNREQQCIPWMHSNIILFIAVPFRAAMSRLIDQKKNNQQTILLWVNILFRSIF